MGGDAVGVSRPFYEEFGWAYDALVPRPVGREVERVVGLFVDRSGVDAGEWVVDAGCGTGRYGLELARFGFRVVGVDRSVGLLEVASRRLGGEGAWVVRGDVTALPVAGVVGGVLCRGVLNDLVRDEERDGALASFWGVLRPGGVLVCDVREWDATAARYVAEPVVERDVEMDRGRLEFRSVTRLDPERRCLLVEERHALIGSEGRVERAFDFVMRCWTLEEVRQRLGRAGFVDVEFGGWHASVGVSDPGGRLVVTARRSPGTV